MIVSEVKTNLIDKIKSTTNSALLEDMLRLMELEEEKLDVYKLSTEQNIAVNEAREQYEKGEIITEKEANDEVDKWFAK